MAWKTIEKPGYFGKKRDELYNLWDEKYGLGNWRIAYHWGDIVVPREMGIQFYEDAYCEFLNNSKETLDWLITTASDVYDTALSNIDSGLDYECQETPNNHIQDISIRRAVLRLGEEFKGDHPMHVRWKDTEGYRINPGVVPFHLPRMIVPGEINDYSGDGIWWESNTIEDFYQKNKVLQVWERPAK